MIGLLKNIWKSNSTPTVKVDEDGINYYLINKGMGHIMGEFLPKIIFNLIAKQKLDTTILIYERQFEYFCEINLFKRQIINQGISFTDHYYAGQIFVFDTPNDAHMVALMKEPTFTIHISELQKYLENLV